MHTQSRKKAWGTLPDTGKSPLYEVVRYGVVELKMRSRDIARELCISESHVARFRRMLDIRVRQNKKRETHGDYNHYEVVSAAERDGYLVKLLDMEKQARKNLHAIVKLKQAMRRLMELAEAAERNGV